MTRVAEGSLRKAWLKSESTFDTYAAFAATDALGIEDYDLNPEMSEEIVRESVGTPSVQRIVDGNVGGKFGLVVDHKPQAAGTAPDYGPALEAVFGTETVSGGAHVEYTFSDTARRSLQFGVGGGDGLFEGAGGIVLEQLDIDAQKNVPARLNFQGAFASHRWAVGGYVGTGGALTGATAIPIKSGYEGMVSEDVLLKLGTSDNSGSGHAVTAVDWDTPQITISPGLDADVSLDDDIIPVVPSVTTGGTIQGGVNHALTIGGNAVGFISAKVSIKNGLHLLDKEASADRGNRVAGGDRLVEGEFVVYFLDDENGFIARNAYRGSTWAVVLRLGPNTAGKRCTVTIPAAKFKVTPIKIPGSEEATYSLAFTAKQSAAAGDECSLKYH